VTILIRETSPLGLPRYTLFRNCSLAPWNERQVYETASLDLYLRPVAFSPPNPIFTVERITEKKWRASHVI